LWGVAVFLLALSCGTGGKARNLRGRIAAARTSRYCAANACYNPSVLALETGYGVTTFAGSKPQYVNVPPTELAKYLESLPMQAWPRGPVVEITQTDDVSDAHALYRNFSAAQQICRSMGLEVQIRPAG
jgi:hypothetical protein